MNRDDASGSERQIRGVERRQGWSRFVALLLISALALASGCGRRPSVGTGAPSGTLPDQEVRDFALTETDQGAPQWKLYARYAAIYDARNAIVARDVRVDFFDEKGAKSSELVAREGEINQLTRDMSATGDVVLQTTEGTRMSTQQLRFLNRSQKVVSDALVRVERGSDVLTGYGFESDPNLRHYEFKRRVSATVRTPSGGLGPGSGK
jgi:LPS export ABC transporter protein LptC